MKIAERLDDYGVRLKSIEHTQRSALRRIESKIDGLTPADRSSLTLTFGPFTEQPPKGA
jgi:hypothetical protein